MGRLASLKVAAAVAAGTCGWSIEVARKPLSVEIIQEGEARFVVRTYADGEVVRDVVDVNRKPTRRPRIPRRRLKSEDMDKTRRKRF